MRSARGRKQVWGTARPGRHARCPHVRPSPREGTPVSTLRPLPYVGVSGVISPRQQMLLEDLAAEAGLAAHRSLLLGVKAAHTTQYLDVENEFGEHWYPVGHDAFAGALRSHAQDRPAGAAHAGRGVAQLPWTLPTSPTPLPRAVPGPGSHPRGRLATGPAVRPAALAHRPGHPRLPGRHPEALRHAGAPPVPRPRDGRPRPPRRGPGAGSARARRGLRPVRQLHGTGRRLDIATVAPFLEHAYDEPDLTEVGIAVAGGLDPTPLPDAADPAALVPRPLLGCRRSLAPTHPDRHPAPGHGPGGRLPRAGQRSSTRAPRKASARAAGASCYARSKTRSKSLRQVDP